MTERRWANMQNADAFCPPALCLHCIQTRRDVVHAQVVLNSHNKIPLFKTKNNQKQKKISCFKKEPLNRVRQKKKKKRKRQRLWLITGTQREQDAKNTKHKSETPNRHRFPLAKQTRNQEHKHIKSLKFYTLVLYVFVIKSLSPSKVL